jgi:acetyltransferase-like isoleucine patch superfamily enzyme
MASAIYELLKRIKALYSPYFRHSIVCKARAAYWSLKLGKMGKGVQIDTGVLIQFNPKRVEIGDNSRLQPNVQLEVHNQIKIGEYTDIGPRVHIQSGDKVIIGNHVGIGTGTAIFASSNTFKTPDGRERDMLLSMTSISPPELHYIQRAPIIIEDYVAIGLNSVVLPGVRIGRGAIVGAGAVVTTDIPPYTIAVGMPARPVKKRVIPESETYEDAQESK